MTAVKMRERTTPTNRVRCGSALKVRRRYKSGVSKRCMDSSSAEQLTLVIGMHITNLC